MRRVRRWDSSERDRSVEGDETASVEDCQREEIDVGQLTESLNVA